MSLLEWLRRLRGSLQRERIATEIDEEVRLHLELRAKALRAAGMEAREAGQAARRQFGNAAAVAERSGDVRTLVWLETLVQDVRYALRQLRRAPGYTAAAGGTLALGIGATTAMFTLVNAVLLRPLPYREPSRLLAVWQSIPQEPRVNFSPAELALTRADDAAIDAWAAWAGNGFTVTGRGDAFTLRAQMVTPNLFAVLGAEARLGRVFGPGEDRSVVLADRLWRERFGADPGLIGQTLVLNGEPYTVAGVMPPEFHVFSADYDAWVPALLHTGVFARHRQAHFLRVIARKRPGASDEIVRHSLAALSRSMRENGDTADRRLHFSTVQEFATASARQPLVLLMAAVVFVLLIACVNVANLALARASVRRREMAIRAALGASRGRAARQLLVESMVLAALGAAAGAAVFLPLLEALSGIPALKDFAAPAADGRVAAFAALVAVAAGLAIGCAPVAAGWRDRSHADVKDGGRTGTSSRARRFRSALVGAEVALAIVVLISAGLLLRSFVALGRVDPGFDAAKVLKAEVALPEARYTGAEQVLAFHRELLPRLRAIPAVEFAGTTTALPFSGQGWGNSVEAEGRVVPAGAEEVVQAECVSAGYLPALGVRLVAGRGFEERDSRTALPVAIVNTTMARRFWPEGNAVGKRVRLDGPWRVVVGVVNDVRRSQLSDPAGPQIYVPYDQLDSGLLTFFGRGLYITLRTAVPPSSVAGTLRSEIRELDPALAVNRVMPMAALVEESMAASRLRTALIGLFALCALALACVGVYGVMSYTVAQRRQEIGLRMALGATGGAIRRDVLGRALAVAGAGTVAGCALAVVTSRMLREFLYGVAPTDVFTFVAAPAGLLGLALLASYVPARRASRVDPVAALRMD